MNKKEFKKKLNALIDEYLENPKKDKKDRVYKVRKWKDMKKEYGVDGDGDINGPSSTEFIFTSGMKYLCGSEHTRQQLEDLIWIIEDWMLEEVE